jgi:3-methyladenine DNA glycosylase Tag
MKDLEAVFERCREMRDLPEELRHRVFYDFGFFVQEMVDYLVWGKLSEDSDIRRFQKKIDASKYNAERFESYIELFEKFYEWLRKSKQKGGE